MPTLRASALRTPGLLMSAFALTGCVSHLHKQTVQLAAVTTPVVQGAADAYHAANTLYDDSVDYESYRAFNRPIPVYNPRLIMVLLPEKDIRIRLRVLQAFQLYVDTLVEITSGTESPALDAASKSVGESLTAISNELAPAIETTRSIANPSATPITPETRNGISTAANALGRFLVYRTTQRDLPPVIRTMDGRLKILCELLESDIDVLEDQQKRNFDTLLDQQKAFIKDAQAHSRLDAEEERNEIMKLPAIVRRERTADAQLAQLRASIVKLYETHHALAAEAQGNNPESLKNKLAELAAAGADLGTFYSSLPAK